MAKKKKVTKSKPIKVIEEQSKSDFKTLKNYIRIFFFISSQLHSWFQNNISVNFFTRISPKKIKLIFVPDFTKIHIIQQDIEFDWILLGIHKSDLLNWISLQ